MDFAKRCLGVMFVACSALLLAAASAGAVTRTLVVWPDQLVPETAAGADGMLRRPDLLTALPGSDTVTVLRPVKLPVGAVVRRISMLVMGLNGTADSSAALLRAGFTTETQPASVAIALSSGLTNGFVVVSADADPPDATVLAGYRYYVKASVQNPYSLLKAIKITYTTP